MKERLKTWLRARRERALRRELDELGHHREAIERRERLVVRALIDLAKTDLETRVPARWDQGVPHLATAVWLERERDHEHV